MKKKFGDRRDGVKVRHFDGMHNLMLEVMPKRCDSDVYMNVKIDVTNLIKYVEDYKKKNPENRITYFHAFAMALGKVIYNRPLLNRYIINRSYYDRKDVIFAFSAKVAFNDKSEEMMIGVNIEKDDNIFSVRDKIAKRVEALRNTKTETDDKRSGTNDAVDIVGRLPKGLRKLVMKVFKSLDNHDMLPKDMIEDNLYYSTAILSNLGNLGIGSIYHHLTDFGTSSILATMGKIHKEPIVDEKGKIKAVDVCDFGVNLDERIADGYYFAKSLQLLEYIIANPKLLEGRADERIEIK
ncbi:MAG: 2-oxo acid dehydrogenase subunit E2 [Bacilli bacterium]|nr:2-oxo acid dehydrogenase subunit E2 [Bacilli bacterium]